MANEIAKTAELAVGNRGIRPRTFNELWRMAGIMVSAGIAPKNTNQEAATGIMMFGMELGLSPIQSLRDICFINGRPSAFGDAVTALIWNSGLLDGAPEETIEGEGDALRATCTMRRKGVRGAVTRTFSLEEARAAGLTTKDTWKNYPKRMLRWRAFNWAARDLFGDVLKGLHVRDVAIDLPPEDYTVREAEEGAQAPARPPAPALAAPVPAPVLGGGPLVRDQVEEELAGAGIPVEVRSFLTPEMEEEMAAAHEAQAPPAAPAPAPSRAPAPAPAAPIAGDPDQVKAFTAWAGIRGKLDARGIATCKAAAGVEYLNPKTPAAALRAAVAAAQDLLR